MKPFDLEAAKRGEPMSTRDGRRVIKFVDLSDIDISYNQYLYYDENKSCYWVDEKGECSIISKESPNDLFMKNKTKKLYIGIKYNNNSHYPYHETTCAYHDINKCKENIGNYADKEGWTIKEIEIEV